MHLTIKLVKQDIPITLLFQQNCGSVFACILNGKVAAYEGGEPGYSLC